MNIQRLFGSQRALKSVEDFTEFEQRAAYFDGDPVIATKKGVNVLERGSQVHFMAEWQELLDFPPAPKLAVVDGKLDPSQASEAEMRGQELFFGKARCSGCHPAPYYTDNSMHDLRTERFYEKRTVAGHTMVGDGKIKGELRSGQWAVLDGQGQVAGVYTALFARHRKVWKLRELAVFQAHHPAAKRVIAPLALRALDVTLDDGHLPVLVEGAGGRDRLRAENGGYVTRRSGERFSRADLERIAADQPERLSANVLLRPAVEAALFPTVAYAAGPGELEYFPRAAPLYRVLDGGVEPQPAVARWSGVLVESRVDKVLEKHGLALDDLAGPPGALEARLVRDALPAEAAAVFDDVRTAVEGAFGRLGGAVARVDPTLERAVLSVRNAALGGTADVEKKLVAALKRGNETLVGQLARARAALYPAGKPQERALTPASFFIRYGTGLVDTLQTEVARWAGVS